MNAKSEWSKSSFDAWCGRGKNGSKDAAWGVEAPPGLEGQSRRDGWYGGYDSYGEKIAPASGLKALYAKKVAATPAAEPATKALETKKFAARSDWSDNSRSHDWYGGYDAYEKRGEYSSHSSRRSYNSYGSSKGQSKTSSDKWYGVYSSCNSRSFVYSSYGNGKSASRGKSQSSSDDRYGWLDAGIQQLMNTISNRFFLFAS